MSGWRRPEDFMSSGLNAAQGLNWANAEILYIKQDDRISCTYRYGYIVTD